MPGLKSLEYDQEEQLSTTPCSQNNKLLFVINLSALRRAHKHHTSRTTTREMTQTHQLLLTLVSISCLLATLPGVDAQRLRGIANSDAGYSGIYLLMTETCDEKGICTYFGTGEYWCVESESQETFPKYITAEQFDATLQHNQRFWKVSYFPIQRQRCKARKEPGCSQQRDPIQHNYPDVFQGYRL
jgi:hypothetical protein